MNDVIAISARLAKNKNTLIKYFHRFPEGMEELKAIKIINGVIFMISESKKLLVGVLFNSISLH